MGTSVTPGRDDARRSKQTLARAKEYLYKQQANGNWEEVQKRQPRNREQSVSGQDISSTQWGGQTALAVFALLVAGERAQDPRLAPAIEFLKKADMIGTYALGIRCQVWFMLPQTDEIKSLMRKDMQKLIGLMKTQGAARGFYDYDATGSPTTHSLSRAHYAVLGVWAAAQSGQEVPGKYWAEVEKAWVGAQEKDGGWRYYARQGHLPRHAGHYRRRDRDAVHRAGPALRQPRHRLQKPRGNSRHRKGHRLDDQALRQGRQRRAVQA